MENTIEDYICLYGAVHKDDQAIWISMMEFNALVKIDIETGLVQLVDCFQNERREGNLHLQIVSYQNKEIFIPWNAENIVIYDIKKREMRYIPIDCNKNPGLFGDGIRDGRYLYLMSETASEIVQFDMESEKITGDYILDNANGQEPFAIYMYVKPIKIDGAIWKISGHRNMSWKFNIQDKQFAVKEYFIKEDVNFIAGSRGQDCVWLIADNDIMYQLSMELELRRQFDISKIMEKILGNTKRESFDCICLSNYLVIVLYGKKGIIKIPVVNNTPDLEEYQYRQYKNACFSIEDDKLVIITANKAILIEEQGEKEVIYNIPQDFFMKMMKEKNDFLTECDIQNIGLVNYVEYICNDSLKGNCISNGKVSVGKRIFDRMKSE